jgi:cytochrome c oxidase subunit 2
MRRVTSVALAGILLASCSTEHSIMNSHTRTADRVAAIGWLMIGISAAVFVLVVSLLLIGLTRRRPVEDVEHPQLQNDRRWIIGGGVVMPSVVLLVLSGLTVWVLAEEQGEPAVRMTVVGHQYWWEIRYEGSSAVTANEFNIPVDEDVDITVESVDVIHSLWVPEFGPKIDVIPGRVNHITWKAQTEGTFRGQCAEYCGLQHANMALLVNVQSRDQFDTWLRQEAADATAPSSAQANAGLAAFIREPCSSCHAIRGTDATGEVGPDLTHLASRTQIGAGVAPLDRGHLGGWIADSQALKPGNLMPPVALSPDELQSLLVYLESLQ